MDSLSNNVTIIYVLAFLLFLYTFCIKLAKKTKTKKLIKPPMPSGSWPLIGHLPLLRDKKHVCKILASIADEYGPIYSLKFGFHDLLVISGWEYVKDCLTTNDRVLATRANIAAGKYIGYNNAIFALAPYGKYWREIRKLATLQLLSSQRLEKLKHVRISEINMFIKELHNLCGSRVSISEMLERLTFNISLRMLVGKRFSSTIYAEEQNEISRYKKAIVDSIYLSGVFVPSDAIPWLEALDLQGYIGAMKRTSKEIDSILSSWLQEHLENRREDDFMDVMISNLDEGSALAGHSRDVVVKATTLILTLTGSGSTSTTLTWALSLLINNPKILKRAQEEIDTNVGTQRWVQDLDIRNLPYLQAIIKETFRLYPPGPTTGIREAMEDCSIGGYHVSKGTRVIINIWKLHRDPRVWKNPEVFDPERFLTMHAGVSYSGQNFEYIPFSAGRRSCAGMDMGMQINYMSLARLIQGFDWESVDGLGVDMNIGLGLALPKESPLEVVVKPRLGLEMYSNLGNN